MTEHIGPPPDGVAPLDQFRAGLLLTDEALGLTHDMRTLSYTKDQLLQVFRSGDSDGT